MKTTPEFRDPLGAISSALSKIHKTLLDNEIEEIEIKLNVKLSPADQLQILLNDPALNWLRALSQLIAAVDEVYFQKEPIQQVQFETSLKSVEDLFSNENDSLFSKQYRSLLTKVPDLMLKHSLLRMALKPTKQS